MPSEEDRRAIAFRQKEPLQESFQVLKFHKDKFFVGATSESDVEGCEEIIEALERLQPIVLILNDALNTHPLMINLLVMGMHAQNADTYINELIQLINEYIELRNTPARKKERHAKIKEINKKFKLLYRSMSELFQAYNQ